MIALDHRSTRFALFIALSIAIHLLTAVGAGTLPLAPYKPGSAPRNAAWLSATIVHADSRQPDATIAEATPDAGPAAAPRPDQLDAIPHSVGPGAGEKSLSLPVPDTWYVSSELDVRAEPLTEVRLHYPEAVAGQPVAGRVRVRLFIDEVGIVRRIQIASSVPEGVFDDAARAGWQDVRFRPARKNGVAVKSQKLIELTFQPGPM